MVMHNSLWARRLARMDDASGTQQSNYNYNYSSKFRKLYFTYENLEKEKLIYI